MMLPVTFRFPSMAVFPEPSNVIPPDPPASFISLPETVKSPAILVLPDESSSNLDMSAREALLILNLSESLSSIPTF